MIRRILLPLAGTSFTPVAIRYAVELAHRHSARVAAAPLVTPPSREPRSVVVHDSPVAVAEPTPARSSLHDVRRVTDALERLAEMSEASGVNITELPAHDDLLSLIRDYTLPYDLLVAGLRGIMEEHTQAGCPVSIGDAVGYARAPILAVSDYYRPVRKAVVALSRSRRSIASMHVFFQMNLWPLEQVTIVHFTDGDEIAPGRIDWLGSYLKASQIDAAVDIRRGRIVDGLLDYVEESDTDVVVMGARPDPDANTSTNTEVLDTIRAAERTLFLWG